MDDYELEEYVSLMPLLIDVRDIFKKQTENLSKLVDSAFMCIFSAPFSRESSKKYYWDYLDCKKKRVLI